MINSYLSCLRRYGLFKGRTNPLIFKEFLFLYLIIVLTFFILWQMWDWGEFNFGNPWNKEDWANNKLLYGSSIFLLLHIPAIFTASIRRLTDAGYKKNALILLFIPILGWFSLLHLLFQPTHKKFLNKNEKLSEIEELSHPLAEENSNVRKEIKEIYNQELGDFSKTGKENMNSEVYHSSLSSGPPTNYSHNTNHHRPLNGQVKLENNNYAENSEEYQYKISVLWTDFYLNAIEKYATFRGNARAGEYFSFIFFLIIFSPILIFLDGLFGLNFASYSHFEFLNMPNWVNNDNSDLSLLTAIYNFYAGKMFIGYLSLSYFLLSITPFLALQARRINDTGKNGSRYLWYFLVPILGWFILLFLSMQKSKYPK